ncbi:MAG TPA: TonB-dependent receptor [Bryobacteraceae bacterium]|nr:TonB-dependent receptor [Bryobacteraceae bacterium]
MLNFTSYVVVLALLGGGVSGLRAQTISGDLVVAVVDQSDLAVSGATLELIQRDTNIGQKAQTDSLGLYLFSQLKPGQYQLNVTMAGFQRTLVDDIRVQVGQRARIDVKLNVSQVTETVTVSAAGATLINAESAAIGQVMETRSIVELPLSGRNFIQLAQLTAGAIPIGIANSPATSWTGRSDTTLSIAGGRESNNSFLLNGIETRNARFGNAGIRPSIDAIQEFNIQRSTFGAEFGRSAAVVNTTMKSGTNAIHGSVFEFFRNKELDANDFFLNRTGRARAPLSQNNYGTAVGGPVVIPKLYNGRNRTFWFFNYEAFRQRTASSATGNYPSLAQLKGNLADDSAGTGLFPRSSAICQANPTSRKCVDFLDPSTGLPFPGNVIPASRLDATTQIAVNYVPAPNVAVPVNSPNFPLFNTQGTPSIINDFDQYNTRLDHQLTSNDQIFGTFSWSDEERDVKALRPLGGEGYPMSNRLVTSTWNHTFNSAILNEFRFGWNRSRTFRLSETSFGPNYAQEVFGLENTTTQEMSYGIPAFNMSGFSGIGSISQAIGATDENFQFTDNLSIIKGRHNVRTGVQIMRLAYFQITNFAGNPTFTFDGRYTGVQTNGYGIGDFLLGYPSRAQGSVGDGSQDMRTTFWGGYLQDDWRIASNFTLNFGLRYEFARSPVEINNRSMYFNPEQAQIFVAGQGVRPDIVDPDWNNFAPRFGFTWRPGFMSNMVVRGGMGIYYATDNFNEEQFKGQGAPFFQQQTLDGDPRTPTIFMSEMLPAFTTSRNTGPFTFDRLNRTPYLNQWSFGIQKSFASDWLFEIEYVGSQGNKMPQRRNLNVATIDPTGTIPVAQRRRYPQFADILLTYNGGWTSYNAMTTKLEKRYSSGLYLLGAYTWSKNLDLGATDDFSTIHGEFKKWDKGRSTLDVPHRFIASYVYELPFGRGKQFASGVGKTADMLIGGWQVSGITTFATGQFQTLGIGSDWIAIGNWTRSIPDVVGDYNAGRALPDAYLNPAAFDYPKDAQGNRVRAVGNAGRNTIQQPGMNNWDLSVLKNFNFSERFRAQFRCETFNTFNHTQFGSANLTMTNTNFGRITSTRVGPRRMQLGLRLTF